MKNLILIVGAGITGLFLFSAFKNKSELPEELPGNNATNRPVVRVGIESMFESAKKGFTNRETYLYDRTTKEAKAYIQTNTPLTFIGIVSTDKGVCYVNKQGYVLKSHVTITDEGQTASTE